MQPYARNATRAKSTTASVIGDRRCLAGTNAQGIYPVHRKMNEQQCLEVIRLFGREMTERRGVVLDAFVFDDGWDDNRTL